MINKILKFQEMLKNRFYKNGTKIQIFNKNQMCGILNLMVLEKGEFKMTLHSNHMLVINTGNIKFYKNYPKLLNFLNFGSYFKFKDISQKDRLNMT